MIAILQYAFNSIAPIICLILVGWVVRRRGFLDEHSLKMLNRFTFRFAFFCMMFVNLYQMEDVGGISMSLILTVVATFVILTLAGWGIGKVVTDRRDRKGTLMQAMFRSNYAVIGLVLAEALAGRRGVELAVLFQLPTVVYYNVVSVVCLSVYSDSKEELRLGKTVKEIFTNPLIMGLIAGGTALVIRSLLPMGPDGALIFSLERDLPWVYQTISYLSRIATPLALIVLGGQLSLGEIKSFRKELIAGVLMKLALAPAIGLSIAVLGSRLGWFVLEPAVVAVLISIYGSPAAVASAVMAAEMGADDKFAGQIVVWTSILGMVSLFVIVSLMRAAGLL